ncbi:MAG: PhoD-like phosphatase N-terminal domain-containing protein, partial [Rubripirellula sp.]
MNDGPRFFKALVLGWCDDRRWSLRLRATKLSAVCLNIFYEGFDMPSQLVSRLLFCVFALSFQAIYAVEATVAAKSSARDPIRLTHGPMLGGVTADSVRVWARTSDPGQFFVHYGISRDQLEQVSKAGVTSIDHDNTGVLLLEGLDADTRYFYQVHVNGRPHGMPGTFRTLPSADESRHPELN